MAFGDAWGFDGPSYSAQEMRRLIATLAGNQTGVDSPTALAVSAQLTPTNNVKIAPGGIVVAATGAGLGGSFQTANDADVTSPNFVATGGSARTDRLILRIVLGIATPEVVQGTPGGGVPPPPTVTGDNFEILARVEMPASTTNITNAMIKDERKVLPLNSLWICTSTTRPANPFPGLEIFETDTLAKYFWSGTAWVPTSLFSPVWAGVLPTAERITSSTSFVDWPVSEPIVTASFTKVRAASRLFVHFEGSSYLTGFAGQILYAVRIGGVDYAIKTFFFNELGVHHSMGTIQPIAGIAAGTYTATLRARVTAGSMVLHVDSQDENELFVWEVP